MKLPKQTVMHCPCGVDKVLAPGLCATCYTLKRQDAAYFGEHPETVLTRDGDLGMLYFGAKYEMKHLPMPASLQGNLSYKFFETGHMV